MKKLLLLICILSGPYHTYAQTCDSSLPVVENFDTNPIGVCWNIVDGDGDKRNWLWFDYSSYKVIASYSVSTAVGALTPNNWIISHSIDLTNVSAGTNVQLSWKIRAGAYWASHEYYTAYVATGNQISDFLSSVVNRGEYIDEVGGATSFVIRTLDVSSFAGKTVYIAFRHHVSTNQSNIEIDNVSITSGGTPQGCISDSDNDGVCDSEDRCPGINDALIGTPCNDGDPCTINDVYNSNCGCSGTFADDDNDGVCNYYDDCPNTVANASVDASGCEIIETSCQEATTHFDGDALKGSNTTVLTFDNSQGVSFTISGIDEKKKGKLSGQYTEIVDVSYDDGQGFKSYKSFDGSKVNTANIDITGNVKAVRVTLTDQMGNSGSNMSINFSPVTYCSTTSSQIPSCIQDTVGFKSSTLTQTGSGTKSITLDLPANSQDASFTISGLDAKLKGRQGSQYNEHVKVTYVYGSGSPKYYEYSGSENSSVDVIINGQVSSITVDLYDQLNIDTSSTMSVDLSTVSYCVSSSARISNSEQTTANLISEVNKTHEITFKIFPNPASNILFVKSANLENVAQTNVLLYNLHGTRVRSMIIDSNNGQTKEMHIEGLATGLYLLRIVDQKGVILKTERIVIK